MIGSASGKRSVAVCVFVVGAVAACLSCGSGGTGARPPVEVPVYRLEVVTTFPHDRGAFTQGLVYENGVLYEGTGQRGTSSLRKVRLETGEVLAQHALGEEYFGEGIAIVGDRIVQLTWTSQLGFVYEKATLRPIGEFRYLSEGWGLAFDGVQLYMSDGSSELQILDAASYEYKGFVTVRSGDTPVQRLNELEFVNGEIFANVWPGDRIARIDPKTGFVTGWIEAGGLLKAEDFAEEVDVLNGIAWDSVGNRLFVTGKLWPKLFEVRVVESGRNVK